MSGPKPEDIRPLLPQTDARWWLPHMKDRRAQAITNCAQGIWQQCEPSRSAMLSSWRLYTSQPLVGSGTQPRMYRRRTPAGTVGGSSFTFNGVKAVLDTYVALMVKDLPGIMFQTKGGSATLQRKALLLDKLIDGTFYDCDFYGRLPQLVLDSVLFPFAGVQVYEDWSNPDKPRVGIDRERCWEDIADEQDAMDGDPDTTYRVRGMDRLKAMATWPDKATEIATKAMSVAQFDPSLMGDDGSGLTDLIVIVETWHRGTGDLDPSAHAIVSGEVMIDEPEGTDHGIERLYSQRPTTGMWAQSMAEQLKGPQRFMNQLTTAMQHASRMTSAGHWLVHQNSNINVNSLDNQQGSVMRYSGTPPQYFPGGDLPPGLVNLWMMTYQKMFETAGVSMSIAQGQTPQLNGSGKAILAYADVQTARFKPCYRELQDFVVRVARQVIRVAASISKKHPAFAVKAPGKMMATVRWADGNLRDEEYVLQPKAINKLADDPVGVLDQIQNFANAGPGWMLPSDGRRLMTQVPDLEAWAGEMNAARDLVEQICDKMLESGEYSAPDGFLPLDESKVGPDNAIRWVHLRLLKAQVDGEDPENMDLLRRWLTEAQQIVDEQKPPPAMQQLPPGAQMGAPPPALPGQPGAPPPQPQAAAA